MSLSFSGVCAGVASVFVDAIALEYWDIDIIIIDNFSIALLSGIHTHTALYNISKTF